MKKRLLEAVATSRNPSPLNDKKLKCGINVFRGFSFF